VRIWTTAQKAGLIKLENIPERQENTMDKAANTKKQRVVRVSARAGRGDDVFFRQICALKQDI
jgi:hypothetical protein